MGNAPRPGGLNIELGFKIDNITVMMLFVVNLISFLVHVFSIEYMRGDKLYTRYFAYLGIFTFLDAWNSSYKQFINDVYLLGISWSFFIPY